MLRVLLGRPRLVSADNCHLVRDVDAHRAPRDAAPATHAAGGAELVDPARQLVRQPLAVACTNRAADAATVNVGVVQGETGVPAAPPLGGLAPEVGGVFDA